MQVSVIFNTLKRKKRRHYAQLRFQLSVEADLTEIRLKTMALHILELAMLRRGHYSICIAKAFI